MIENAASRSSIAMVFAGGIGLGAYQAGAFEAFQDSGRLPDWVLGSSAGAVTAALVAGNAPTARPGALRSFWNTDASAGNGSAVVSPSTFDPWRHAHNWASVLQTRLFGSSGHFRPRVGAWPLDEFVSLYDLSPMRHRIEQLVDFDRLNSGDTRLTVAMTDIETGELVLVDTAKGDVVTPEHLIASCGLLPEFAPIQLEGRWLGDGGLCANAPIEPVVEDIFPGDRLCFVVDLYARDGLRPTTLQSAIERKADLIFGNQTYSRLEASRRERTLRKAVADLMAELPKPALETVDLELVGLGRSGQLDVVHLSYRAGADEAGPEKGFDISPSSVKRRWREGALDMKAGLEMHERRAHARGPMTATSIRRSSVG